MNTGSHCARPGPRRARPCGRARRPASPGAARGRRRRQSQHRAQQARRHRPGLPLGVRVRQPYRARARPLPRRPDPVRPKGVYSKQLLLDMAPLYADKKTVASFLLDDQACDGHRQHPGQRRALVRGRRRRLARVRQDARRPLADQGPAPEVTPRAPSRRAPRSPRRARLGAWPRSRAAPRSAGRRAATTPWPRRGRPRAPR